MILIRPLVYLDFETTGTIITKDRILEIACLKVFPDGTEEEKVHLINPGMEIPVAASEIHGITAEKIAKEKAPYFKLIAKGFLEYLYGCDIAGFNSDIFDVPLLIEEFHRCGIEFPTWDLKLIDVRKNEIRLRPNTLSGVYERTFGETFEDAHTALADVRATKRILDSQLQEEEAELSPNELDVLCQGDKKRFDYAGKMYVRADGVVCMSFGKYKDEDIRTMDKWYRETFFLGGDFPIQSKKLFREYIKNNPLPNV